MARFTDEPAPDDNNTFVKRIKQLIAAGFTVEVYARAADNSLVFRIWPQRDDGSSAEFADPTREF